MIDLYIKTTIDQKNKILQSKKYSYSKITEDKYNRMPVELKILKLAKIVKEKYGTPIDDITFMDSNNNNPFILVNLYQLVKAKELNNLPIIINGDKFTKDEIITLLMIPSTKIYNDSVIIRINSNDSYVATYNA